VNAAFESDSLIALDKRTGKTVWSVRGLPSSWNTPTLVKSAEGREELVVSVNGKLRAFAPKTGEELWFSQGIKAAELCPSIVAHNGVVYVIGHPGGQSMAVRAGGSGDVSQTHVLWEAKKGSNVGSPVILDGHLYFANDSRGVALCMKADTGEVVYEQPFSRTRDRWYASPVLAAGRLYYVSRTTGTVVLAAKPQFEVLATNVLDGDTSVFNGSPAMVDNQIFLRSDLCAYCLGARR
jgi:outer membrane protein assembly factor BamB